MSRGCELDSFTALDLTSYKWQECVYLGFAGYHKGIHLRADPQYGSKSDAFPHRKMDCLGKYRKQGAMQRETCSNT